MRGVLAVLGLVVGWGFVGAGLFAWSRDPENRVGMLMAATGFAWLLSLAGASDIPLLFTFGTVIGSLFFATAAHMLLAAPDGRLHSTFERRLVAAIYSVTLLVLPLFLFTDPQQSYRLRQLPREPPADQVERDRRRRARRRDRRRPGSCSSRSSCSF